MSDNSKDLPLKSAGDCRLLQTIRGNDIEREITLHGDGSFFSLMKIEPTDPELRELAYLEEKYDRSETNVHIFFNAEDWEQLNKAKNEGESEARGVAPKLLCVLRRADTLEVTETSLFIMQGNDGSPLYALKQVGNSEEVRTFHLHTMDWKELNTAILEP